MTPSFLFIDVILLAYRLGQIRYEEQKTALLKAAREATDAMSFMPLIEQYGITPRSYLYKFISKVLAAPVYYRDQYPLVLGIRRDGEEAEPFLNNLRVIHLVEGILTIKQQDSFNEAYWWFVHNHKPSFTDPKRGQFIGVYATDPQDNESTMKRFEDYLMHLVNHKNKTVRERFEDFPADIVLAILRRAYGRA